MATIFVAPEIKKMMAALKRTARSDHRRQSDFPRWREGMTTKAYVKSFSTSFFRVPCPMHAPDRAAPSLSAAEDRILVETDHA